MIEQLVSKLAASPSPQANSLANPNTAYAQQLENLYQQLVKPDSLPSASEEETKVLSVPE